MIPTRPGPILGGERLDVLDALRGFALAGVLMANLVAFSLYFFLTAAETARLPTAAVDRLLDPAIGVLVIGKFVSLFSLLFGVGFALQMQRQAARDGGVGRYLRRLAVLLAIGVAHAALWWGDILRYYALIGLVLLALMHVRPRTLAIVGVLLVAMPHLPFMATLASGGRTLAAQDTAFAMAHAAFSSTDAAVALHGNAVLDAWWIPVHWGMVLSIGGCMLVGAAMGRSGMLRDPAAHADAWKRLRLALPIGLMLALVMMLHDYGRLPLPPGWSDASAVREGFRMLNQLIALVLALGYAAWFVRALVQPAWRRWLLLLAPVGRMALTHYLTHTLLGLALFYGAGAGIGPRFGLVGVVLAWAAIFAAQIAISPWWLARFRFGPAEWIWRSLTYGKRQPMRVRAAPTSTRTAMQRADQTSRQR